MFDETSLPGGSRRLTRSSRERVLAGVAGGLAEYFDVEPVVVRLLWVAAAILSGGLAVPIYLVMWWLMPRDDTWRGGAFAEPSVVPRSASASDASDLPPDVDLTQAPTGDAPGAERVGVTRPAFPPPIAHRGDVRRRQRSAGLILVGIGVLIFAGQIGLLQWSYFRYAGPILLILVGLSLLLRQTGWRR